MTRRSRTSTSYLGKLTRTDLDNAASITCPTCGGQGAVSQEGCVECVATGLDLSDTQWEAEYAAWAERNL